MVPRLCWRRQFGILPLYRSRPCRSVSSTGSFSSPWIWCRCSLEYSPLRRFADRSQAAEQLIAFEERVSDNRRRRPNLINHPPPACVMARFSAFGLRYGTGRAANHLIRLHFTGADAFGLITARSRFACVCMLVSRTTRSPNILPL